VQSAEPPNEQESEHAAEAAGPLSIVVSDARMASARVSLDCSGKPMQSGFLE
jgi:hypothetical protein